MSATDSTTLRLRRTFDAPWEEVFDAWTTLHDWTGASQVRDSAAGD